MDDYKELDEEKYEYIQAGYQLPNNFPTRLEETPYEETLLAMNDVDKRVEKAILGKFSGEIASIKCLGPHAIDRFIINWRHMEIESERLKTTLDCFEKYLKCHKTHNIDTILLTQNNNNNNNKDNNNNNNREDIEKTLRVAKPWYIYGIDKQGHPIVWDNGTTLETLFNGFSNRKDGTIDYYKTCKARSYTFRHLYNLQIQLSKYYRKEIFTYTQIFDLSYCNGVALKNLEMITKHRQFWKDMSISASTLFPETIHKVYFINAPYVIRIAAYLMSQFVHSSTLIKIKVLGSNFIDELKKEMDINMIPPKYGGKGVWEMRLLNVPKGFPFETNDEHLPTFDELEKQKKEKEKIEAKVNN